MAGDDALARMRAAFEATGNPVYVWHAISVHSGTGEIPDWCREKIFDWAEAISNIAFDRAKQANEVPARDAPSGAPFVGDPIAEEPFIDTPIAVVTTHKTPAEKVEAACEVFGFAKAGWNAFEAFARDGRAFGALDALDEAKRAAREPIGPIVGKLAERSGQSPTSTFVRDTLVAAPTKPAAPQPARKTFVVDLARRVGISRTRLYGLAARAKKILARDL